MDLEEQPANLASEHEMAALLRQTACRASIETPHRAGYIGVRPLDRSIAACVNLALVDIATEQIAKNGTRGCEGN